MRQMGLIEGLVGVGHREAPLHQPSGQILGACPVAVQAQGEVGWLPPGIARETGIMSVGLLVEVVVQTKDTKRRDDVLAKVLVLVVPKYHAKARREVVNNAPQLAAIIEQPPAQPTSRRESFILTHFRYHFGGPVGAVTIARIDVGGSQDLMERHHYLVVRHHQTGKVTATNP